MIRREPWSADELHSLLRATVDTRLEAAWHLLAFAGVRVSEVLALRWADIDMVARRINVCNAVVGVPYADLAVPPMATDARAIDARLVLSVLVRHHQRQHAERSEWGAYYHDEDLVICRENGHALLPGDLHRALGRVAADAGLPAARLADLRRIGRDAAPANRVRS